MNPRLTSDARRALVDAGFTRRAFLKGSGALIVTFASVTVTDHVSGVFAQGFNGTGSPSERTIRPVNRCPACTATLPTSRVVRDLPVVITFPGVKPCPRSEAIVEKSTNSRPGGTFGIRNCPSLSVANSSQ